MTWQPGEADDGEEPAPDPTAAAAGQPDSADLARPVGLAGTGGTEAGGYRQYRETMRRGLSWATMFALLAVGLCGLAGGAAGAVRQLLPREFSPAQEHQIQTWEQARRWRALRAGQIFPARPSYLVPGQVLDSRTGMALTARRLGIAPQSSCAQAVSPAAAAILAAAHCAAVLRATYVDASGSMVVTLGVAAMPTGTAAMASSARLGDQTVLRPFSLARSAADRFRPRQRQLSVTMQDGPYLVFATAGFADGRRHVPLSTDDYLQREMSSLAAGLARSVIDRLTAHVPAVTCPGAPGC